MMSTASIPGYLAGANSDPLMVGMAIFLVVLVLVAGVFYFKLHAIPEHIAHGKNHTQIQLITILTILALFTHNNIFWVAALILAVVELPDFLSPLKSIASSLKIIANSKNNTPSEIISDNSKSTQQESVQQVVIIKEDK